MQMREIVAQLKKLGIDMSESFLMHFIFKTMHLFVGSGFLVSHRRLRKPRHFYGLSSLGTMSDHNWRVFHPRGDLSLLIDSRDIFSLPF